MRACYLAIFMTFFKFIMSAQAPNHIMNLITLDHLGTDIIDSSIMNPTLASKMMAMMPSQPKMDIIYDDQTLIEVEYTEEGEVKKRTFYQKGSQEVVMVKHTEEGLMYRQQTLAGMVKRQLEGQPRSRVSGRPYFQEVKFNFEQWKMKEVDLSLKQYKSLNQANGIGLMTCVDLPIDFYSGSSYKIEGFPVGFLMEIMGLKWMYGVVDYKLNVEFPEELVTLEVGGMISQVDKLSELESQGQFFGHYPGMNAVWNATVLVTEDTLLVSKRACQVMQNGKADLNKEKLNISYTDPEYNLEESLTSSGPVENVKQIDELTFAFCMKDVYGDIYLGSKSEIEGTPILGFFWKANRGNQYNFYSYAQKCLDEIELENFLIKAYASSIDDHQRTVLLCSPGELWNNPTYERLRKKAQEN